MTNSVPCQLKSNQFSWDEYGCRICRVNNTVIEFVMCILLKWVNCTVLDNLHQIFGDFIFVLYVCCYINECEGKFVGL